MFRVSCLLILGITHSAICANEEPMVTLPDLGTLKGMTYHTIGIGPSKEYYQFKNIPYADSVSNEKRFTQPVPFSGTLGTPEDPYDATRPGPMCHQGKLNNEGLETLSNKTMKEVVAGALGIDPDAIANYGIIYGAIKVLSAFLETDITMNETLGDLLFEWLDVSLGVSEDCLHLAVNTPIDPTEGNVDAKLPVMVFVYGGAFYMGTQLKMDAARLGHVDDVVVVAINYRVGSLGFMCLDTDEAAGNMGMLDMVEALKWVQKHISHFGGDPDQVTIFGESAGSASIGHLVLSPLTTGLFSKGIGQSGSAVSPWAFDPNPEIHSRKIAEKLGCNHESHDDIVTCMRTKTAVEIETKHRDYIHEQRAAGEMGFGGTIPCAQTKGIKKFYEADQTPDNLLVRGNYSDLPIFFGANSHEGSFVYGVTYSQYLVPNGYHNDTEFLKNDLVTQLLHTVGINQGYALKDLLEAYYFQDWQFGSLEYMTPGALDMLSTFFLKASSYKMVEENSKRSNSYWYSIEHPMEKKSMYHVLFLNEFIPHMENPGVCHADELPFIFHVNLPMILCDLPSLFGAMSDRLTVCLANHPGALDALDNCISELTDTEGEFKREWGECITGELTEKELVWSDRLVRAWTNFARTGDPTPEGDDIDLPEYPLWTQESPKYIAFREDGGHIEENYRLTYNAVMKSGLTEAPTEPTAPVTTPTEGAQPDGASLTSVNFVLLLFAVLFAVHRC